MLLGYWSLVTLKVCFSRSDKATAQPEQGFSNTTCIPIAGWAKVMLEIVANLMSTSP